MASTFDRIIYSPDDVLALKIELWYVLEVFCQCFTCDGHLTTVYQVRTLEEIFQNCWDTAYFMHIFHIVLARGSAATLSHVINEIFVTYLRSAMYGVLSETSWKSSMVRGISAARAIASKCRTLII